MLKRNAGQFIPISAMVMFTTVVFLIAVVNIYKVSRTKLKVQNLADAAALNLASQEAQAYNVVTDRNEWLNHMTAGVPSPSDPNAPAAVKDCSAFNMGEPNNLLIPPVTCVENTINIKANGGKDVFARRVWQTRGDPKTATDGAIGYAMLIRTVNVAQKLFVQAYNSFLGDQSAGIGSGGNTGGPTNFEGLLKADIPDLDKPNIHLVAWNSGDLSIAQAQQRVDQNTSNFDSKNMVGLKFEVDHDIETRYQTKNGDNPVRATTFSELLFGRVNYGDDDKRNGPLYGQPKEAVGWMVPARDQPTISVNSGQGRAGNQVGVGVYVSEDMKLPVIGTLSVGAKSKAYVVKGSGEMGDSGGRPVFKPTYWVKLAN